MILSILFSWFLPFLLLLLAGMVIRLSLQQRANRIESARIKALQDKIEAALADQTISFDASLRQSLRRANKDMHPGQPARISQKDVAREAPEKYRILSNLAAKGMSADEIAAILGISATEAGQLVRLSNLAGSSS